MLQHRTEDAVATRRRGEDPEPAGRFGSFAFQVFCASVFFLPVQLDLESVDAVLGSRLSPSDFLLALAILLDPTVVRVRRGAVAMLPVALVGTLAFGALLALAAAGAVTTHALTVKLGGGVVLALFCLVTATYVRAGRALTIVRVFLVGMVFWAIVAYVDWRVLDILPFVQAKTESRFGGMQYDPNNAAAGYGLAFLLAWRLGPRVFRHRAAWLASMAVCATALALTYSRGGYIATAAGLMTVLLVERVHAERWVRLSAVGVIVAAVVLTTGFAARAADDFTRRPDNVIQREELASDAITDFVESGGVGIGLGTYRDDHDEIVHNTFLWMIVEMSLVGLAFLAAMVTSPTVSALRLRRHDLTMASALLGAHIVMVTAAMNIEALYQRPWWLVVGLLCLTTVPVRQRAART